MRPRRSVERETWILANKLRGSGGIVDSRDFLESEGFTVVDEFGWWDDSVLEPYANEGEFELPAAPLGPINFYRVEPPREWARDGNDDTSEGYNTFVVYDDRGRRRFRHLSNYTPNEYWAYLESDPRDI